MKECTHCLAEHNLRGSACRVCKDGLFRYKMTRIDIIELHKSQDGKCALCDVELEMFVGKGKGGFVDHCHKTGAVRGILCNKCNTTVGGLENLDMERILNYISYRGVAQSG